MALYSSGWKARFGVVHEQQRDLLEVPNEYFLAHCVAKELEVFQVIAVEFKFRSDRTRQIYLQHPAVDKTCNLRDQRRFFYHLVVKSRSSEKPEAPCARS